MSSADTLENIKGVAKNYGSWILEHENVWGVAVTLNPMDPKSGKFTIVVMHTDKMKEQDMKKIKDGLSVPVIFKSEKQVEAMKYMKKI
jgi:CRISPR/Cas system CMR subunit Cmr6 (Cas7 group RAMP superfamily)